MASNKNTFIALGVIGSLIGGSVALFTYLETRKKRKLEEEVLGLDRQIKMLELSKKRVVV